MLRSEMMDDVLLWTRREHNQVGGGGGTCSSQTLLDDENTPPSDRVHMSDAKTQRFRSDGYPADFIEESER